MSKKKWEKPELNVLVRRTPAEAFQSGCKHPMKTVQGSPSSEGDNCAIPEDMGSGTGCLNCSDSGDFS